MFLSFYTRQMSTFNCRAMDSCRLSLPPLSLSSPPSQYKSKFSLCYIRFIMRDKNPSWPPQNFATYWIAWSWGLCGGSSWKHVFLCCCCCCCSLLTAPWAPQGGLVGLEGGVCTILPGLCALPRWQCREDTSKAEPVEEDWSRKGRLKPQGKAKVAREDWRLRLEKAVNEDYDRHPKRCADCVSSDRKGRLVGRYTCLNSPLWVWVHTEPHVPQPVCRWPA